MGTSTRDTHDTYAWHTYHAARDTWLHVYLVAELVISVIVVIVLRPQPPHGVTRPRPSAVKGVAGAGGSQALSHLGNIIMTTITWWRSLVTSLCYQIVSHSPGGTGRSLRLETVRWQENWHPRCSQSLRNIQLKKGEFYIWIYKNICKVPLQKYSKRGLFKLSIHFGEISFSKFSLKK